MENKIVERIELNTEAGKYIKCNNCGRLSPEQKYCKYCFGQLMETKGGSEVRQIYISRAKNYSPVSDFSRMREKIDSEFTPSEIDFAALGLTEEEYNLKYTPPTADTGREEYKAEVSQKFDEAYRRFEKQAEEAYKASKEQREKESVSLKQVIDDTPAQAVFASTIEEEPQSAKGKGEGWTFRRQSARFKMTFLSGACFAANLLIISTLFINLIGGAFGMDVISLVPSLLGAQIRENAWLVAAQGEGAFVLASVSYMLVAALALYQFISFSTCVLLDRKQKNYAGFVISFTSLLAAVVVMFALLIAGFSIREFVAGTIILLVASVVNCICAAGKMMRE